MNRKEREIYEEDCEITELKAKISELEIRLMNVYNAGMNGIKYVGTANYAERERDAIKNLTKAMF